MTIALTSHTLILIRLIFVVHNLDAGHIRDLQEFSGHLNLDHVCFIGHSFGASTALTTIARAPKPFKRCVVRWVLPSPHLPSNSLYLLLLPTATGPSS